MASSLKITTKTQTKQRHGTKIFIMNKETRSKVKKRTTTTSNKPIKKIPCISRPTPSTNNTSTFDGLKSKLDFSYDSLATIQVIFDSLKITYANNQNEFDRLKNNTRLGDIEKELLTAYDDLTLQVSHLKKDVDKLEKQMRDNAMTEEEPTRALLEIEQEDEEEPSLLCSPTDTTTTISSSPSLSSFKEDMEYSYDFLISSMFDYKQQQDQVFTIPQSPHAYWDLC